MHSLVLENPTSDVVATFINNLVSDFAYLVVDVPAAIAGAIFSDFIKPKLKNCENFYFYMFSHLMRYN